MIATVRLVNAVFFARHGVMEEEHRIGGRLGLFPEHASFEQAHDEMLAITPPADAYELHMNLISHGRAVCRPKPRCGECGLRRMCVARREGRVEPVA